MAAESSSTGSVPGAVCSDPPLPFGGAECPLCGSRRSTAGGAIVGTDQRSYELRLCGGCGVRSLAMMPDTDTLSEHYGPGYYSQNMVSRPRARLRLKGRLEGSRSVLLRAMLKMLSIGWLPLAPHSGAQMLDVGCGDGAALVRARSLGWDPEGCEFDSNACAQARDHGFVCYAGDWSSELPRGCYELVLMNQVLEHISDPILALRSVRSSMVEGGVLLLGLPNWDSSAALAFGTIWWANLAPEHVWQPRFAHVDRALELSGFRVDRVRVRNLFSDYFSFARLRDQWALAKGAGWSLGRFIRTYTIAAATAARARLTATGPVTGEGSMYTLECTAVDHVLECGERAQTAVGDD